MARCVFLGIAIAMCSAALVSCGGDGDDDEDSGEGAGGGSGSAKYGISLSCQKSEMKNGKWYYTATINVSGASASDVTVLGVKWQKSGSSHATYKEAGGTTTRATCKFGGLDTKSTYYVQAYANVNGTRIESSKQTIRIR